MEGREHAIPIHAEGVLRRHLPLEPEKAIEGLPAQGAGVLVPGRTEDGPVQIGVVPAEEMTDFHEDDGLHHHTLI